MWNYKGKGKGKTKGKGKFHPITGHEGREGEKIYTSTLSLTLALDKMSGQRHAPATLPPGKTRYPLYKRLGGPHSRSGRVLCEIIQNQINTEFILYNLVFETMFQFSPHVSALFPAIIRYYVWNILRKKKNTIVNQNVKIKIRSYFLRSIIQIKKMGFHRFLLEISRNCVHYFVKKYVYLWMWSVLLPTIACCNVYVDLNPQFLYATLFCYIEGNSFEWNLVVPFRYPKKIWKLTL